jgi:ferredoxin-NADP reductase
MTSAGQRASVPVLTAQFGSKVTIHPADERGLIELEALLGTVRPETLVYCCGPEELLTAVSSQCAAWPTGILHLERFSPKGQAPFAVRNSFEVELALSGKTITVGPHDWFARCASSFRVSA